MNISIIIVNWNAGTALMACLSAIYATAADLNPEVIVVDNASTDGSQLHVAEHFTGVRLVRNSRNVGFAPACNQGLELARGDYMLWLNPDVQLQPQALEQMLALLADRPEVGLVGPRITLPDGAVDWDAGRNLPSLRGVLAELTYLRRIFPTSRFFGHWRMGWWDHLSSRAVPCLVGACMMMPRTVWMRVGRLDETIPMYFEDIDYCRRVQQASWQVYYLAEAQVRHEGGVSSAHAVDRAHLEELKWLAQWLYFRRYRRWWAALAFRLMVSTLGAMRAAALSLAWLPSFLERRTHQAVALAWQKAVRLALWGVGLRPIQVQLP